MTLGTNSEGRRGGYNGDLLQGRLQGETHKEDLDNFAKISGCVRICIDLRQPLAAETFLAIELILPAL